MDAGHLRQVNVRSEAFLLVGHDALGVELAIKVAGHEVRIDPVGTDRSRHREAALAGHLVDALDQVFRERAFRHLLADLADLPGRKGVVQPGEQRPQRQVHESVPLSSE